MVEHLTHFCELLVSLIDEINPNLLRDPNINKSLANLEKRGALPDTLNIKHRTEGHCNQYPLKNCPENHCFECLLSRIASQKPDCSHNKPLTLYEIEHIPYLTSQLKNIQGHNF